MSQSTDFTWVDFYMEFASKLLAYSENRDVLIEKIREVFEKTEINLPTLEKDGNVFDIDPFTVFGLFNKGITTNNRIKILTAIAEEFSVDAPVPQSFDGIPVLNNQKATFYQFVGDRNENDLDNLWIVFKEAITYADDQTHYNRHELAAAFDTVSAQQGIRWNITMGLFWIRPYTFINLDSKNRQFLMDSAKTSEKFVVSLPKLNNLPSGNEYLELCDACTELFEEGNHDYKSIPELSVLAWKTEKKPIIFDVQKIVDAISGDIIDETINALSDEENARPQIWLYTVYDDDSWAECWRDGIVVLGMDDIGEYLQYESKEDLRQALMAMYKGDSSRKNQALMTWNFSRVMKVNDVIFAKRGNTVVGKGVITGEYEFNTERQKYRNTRTVHWLAEGAWEYPGRLVAKRLTDMTPYNEIVETLNSLCADEGLDDIGDGEREIKYSSYYAEDFLRDVYMDEKDYDTIVAVLKNKKNIILQGAPGVGKTYAAKRLAYSIMGEKNPERVQMIQFHQSYSYEDFIEGYRPVNEGFTIKKGAFYKFCKKAADDDENDYFFIIDEINRGNLSKIFGELFMLIETDKRGIELQLLYSDEKFSVPQNVYLIGMMNTADRSLAMLDYALRRRFAFIDMKPGFDTDGFSNYQESLQNEKFNSLISCVKRLNTKIAEDASLGEGFCIGHSYFCNLSQDKVNDRTLSSIVEFELIPLLKEYWFDESDKVNEWSDNLRRVIR